MQADRLRAKPKQRAQLDGFVRLGALYGVLNYFGPLIRLFAIIAFATGHFAWSRLVLAPPIGNIVANIVQPALTRLVEPKPVVVDGDETSASAHGRAIARQTLRLVLQLAGVGLGTLWLDAAKCGLRPSGAELGAGLAAAALMCGIWRLVAAAVPRERLTVDAADASDVSSATEDDLLRQMPPGRRAASLALRCAAIAVGSYADMLVFFVFLPARLDGVDPPASPTPLAAAAVALAYGSQHLRFRNEWLLAACFGCAQLALRAHFDGLAPVLAASVAFATYRHAARAHDEAQQVKSG